MATAIANKTHSSISSSSEVEYSRKQSSFQVVNPIFTSELAFKILALFLIIFSVRLGLIYAFSVPIPIQDQWDGEASTLLKPWIENHRHWSLFFTSQNEHRIFPTKLLALGLFLINGQWDAQVEMVVNAFIFSLSVSALSILLICWLGATFQNFIFAAISIYSCLPYAYENIVCGFQSEFYFLILFSILAIWGLSFHRQFSKYWIVGAVSLSLAIVSLGSGVIAALAIAIFELFRGLQAKSWRVFRSHFATLVLTIIVILIAIKIRIPSAPNFVAPNLSVFFTTFFQALAWPFHTPLVFGIVMYLPIAILAVQYLFQFEKIKSENVKITEFLLAIGLFVGLQAAAIGYARGGLITIAPSRYGDILALGALVNFFSLILLVYSSKQLLSRQLIKSFFVIWIGLLAYGLTRDTKVVLTETLPGRLSTIIESRNRVIRYLQNKNFETFSNNNQPSAIYPNLKSLRQRLDDPIIQKILPYDTRLPLVISPISNPQNTGFVLQGYYPTTPFYTAMCWGSYGTLYNRTMGQFQATVSKVHTHYLTIPLAGYLGSQPELSLTLRDQSTGQTVSISPTKPATEHWKNEFIKSPGKHMELTAVDHNPEFWFAFGNPVEIGLLSYWTAILLSKWEYLLTFGIILWMFSTRFSCAKSSKS